MAENAADQVGSKLQALYESASPDEQRIIDFILGHAAEHVAAQDEVQGFGKVEFGAMKEAGTQDAMKWVLFGAAGATEGGQTPSVIAFLVARA